MLKKNNPFENSKTNTSTKYMIKAFLCDLPLFASPLFGHGKCTMHFFVYKL